MLANMNELLTNLLVAVIVAVIVVVTRYFIPTIRQAIEESKFAIVLKYTSQFVRAAEQTMSHLTGVEKKTWVTQILKNILIAKNISLTDEQLDAIIEATVFDMNLKKDEK